MKLESVKEDKIVEYPKQEKIKISVLKKLKLDSWKKISGIAFVLNFLYQHISNATIDLSSIEDNATAAGFMSTPIKENDISAGGSPLMIKIKIFDYIEFGLCLNILIALVILVVKAIKIKKDDKEDLKKKLLPFIIYMIFSIIILIIFEFISIGYL